MVSSSLVRGGGNINPTSLCGGEQIGVAVGAGRHSKVYRAIVLKSGNWFKILYAFVFVPVLCLSLYVPKLSLS